MFFFAIFASSKRAAGTLPVTGLLPIRTINLLIDTIQMNMLRATILTIVSAVLLGSTAMAAPVDPQTARTAASRFVALRGKALSTPSAPDKAPSEGATAGQATPYYIYDVADGGGFVIISGDDRTPTVLGYTDRGSYTTTDMEHGLGALLAVYASQIQAMAQTGAAKAPAAAETTIAQQARHYVAPLISTQWNQRAPYNNLCPVYNNSNGSSSGQRGLTGCVATTLAQIMAYYRYPAKTTAAIPAYSFTSGGKDVRVEGVAAGTAIDWVHMTDTYTSASTAEEQQAVAQLMQLLGTGVQMNYGSQSAANLTLGKPLLRDHLGYDERIDYVYRRGYSQRQWTDLLYGELAQGRPVAYRANSPSGGHAFVIDGYDSDDLFHVNWGWGGKSDGFFRIGSLYSAEPGAESTNFGSGYAYEQEALIGIMPNDGVDSGTDVTARPTARYIKVSGNTVSITFTNFSGTTIIQQGGIAIAQANGTLSTLGSTTLWLSTNYERTVTFTIKGLADGTYHLVPVYTPLGTTAWKPCGEVATEYVLAVVKGGKVTLSLGPADQSAVTVKSWAMTGNLVKNVKQLVKVTLTNTAKEYYGKLYCLASPSTAKGSAASTAQVALPTGREVLASFYFTPTTAGTYHVWIAKDAAGNQPVGHTTVTITDTDQNQANLSVGYVAYDNIVNNVVYGTTRTGTLILNNKATADFDGRLVVKLYRGVTGSNSMTVIDKQLVSVRVAAGEQTRVRFGFANTPVGYRYGLRLFYEGEQAVVDNNANVIYSRAQRSGIIFYDETGATTATPPSATVDTGDAAAIDMRGVSGISTIKPSTNPNALYILDAGATVPADIAKKNVVKGNYANTITLSDGYALAVPCDIEVGSISYTRSMAANTQGARNWQTLALPFAPSAITTATGAVQIDQKRLYVSEFGGTGTDGMPVFVAADKIGADRPYVIKAEGDLKGATLTFKATHVTLKAQRSQRAMTDAYDMVGSTLRQNLTGSYVLNGSDNAMAYQAEGAEVEPFRAYMVPKEEAAQHPASIVIEATATGIDAATWSQDEDGVPVYTVGGQLIGTTQIRNRRPQLQQYGHGTYIIKGIKVTH